MKRRWKVPKEIWLIAIGTAVILASFNNCQSNVRFGATTNSVNGVGSTEVNGTSPGPDPQPAPPVTPESPPVGNYPPPAPPPAPPQDSTPPVLEVAGNCASLTNYVATREFQFPNPKTTCAWNQNGNLKARDQYLQARIEQAKDLDLPAGAKICKIQMSFPVQQFQYDDHFMLLLNDVVLASSYDFSYRLAPLEGTNTWIYDWNAIVGAHWDSGQVGYPNREGVFCAHLENSMPQCRWPATEMPGEIAMSFPEEVIFRIMARPLGTLSDHEFRFISIGDNDENDCEHSDVAFSVQITYVQPSSN